MAGGPATEAARPLKSALLLRPMPGGLLLTVALLVLLIGAAYCSGYEALIAGRVDWPASLLWSAYAVLPWLALFEMVKRHEWEADRPLAAASIGLLLCATAAASILIEIGHKELLLGRDSPPLALQAMRRLPAAAAMLLLLALCRREQHAEQRRAAASPDKASEEAEALQRHAPDIRWIQAADNYLELHLGNQVQTRRMTMRQAAALLEPLDFVRIHRSVIVNRRYVERVTARAGGATVKIAGGPTLPTGRAFSANLSRLG